jgi:hypothetical protein
MGHTNMGVENTIIRNFDLWRWTSSVLEIGMPVGAWNIDQLHLPPDNPQNRRGGYCGPYVLAQLALFFLLCRALPTGIRRKTWLCFAYVSMVAAFMPRQFDLRYYMFWFIALISMNLVMLQTQPQRLRAMLASGIISLALVVCYTGGFFLLPSHITIENLPTYIKKNAPYDWVPGQFDATLIANTTPGATICIFEQQPFTYIYTDYFHPPLSYQLQETRNCPDHRP